jgi:hypothetical protein
LTGIRPLGRGVFHDLDRAEKGAERDFVALNVRVEQQLGVKDAVSLLFRLIGLGRD